MVSFSPEQQHIAETIHQVELAIARGEIEVNGVGPFWKYGLVHAVCQRLEDVSQEMVHSVYGVLRLIEQGTGQPQ